MMVMVVEIVEIMVGVHAFVNSVHSLIHCVGRQSKFNTNLLTEASALKKKSYFYQMFTLMSTYNTAKLPESNKQISEVKHTPRYNGVPDV